VRDGRSLVVWHSRKARASARSVRVLNWHNPGTVSKGALPGEHELLTDRGVQKLKLAGPAVPTACTAKCRRVAYRPAVPMFRLSWQRTASLPQPEPCSRFSSWIFLPWALGTSWFASALRAECWGRRLRFTKRRPWQLQVFLCALFLSCNCGRSLRCCASSFFRFRCHVMASVFTL
jgi:hypothetical protein